MKREKKKEQRAENRKQRTKSRMTVLLLFIFLLAAGCDQSAPNGNDGRIGTDYSDSNNWLVLPAETKFNADVIYFYPTTYIPESPDDPDVCEIDNISMRAGAPRAFQAQATAFETLADIYAPFYRQVNARILAGMNQPDMIKTQSGASKEDVFAALDYYFESYNHGRPFFLAGHSQGAMMIYIILQDYAKKYPDRFENMVAAYMLGNAPTKEWLAANPHVKFAQGAEDTGVLISWNTEGPGNIGQYSMVVPEGSVAINPLNWRTDETPAGVDENKGSYVPDGSGGYKHVDGLTGARVDVARGSVIVEGGNLSAYALPPDRNELFGSESYHTWDFAFFYMNIRENAALRLERFLK